MQKNNFVLVFSVLLLSISARAEKSPSEICVDFKSCVNAVSAQTGQTYLFDSELGKVQIPNLVEGSNSEKMSLEEYFSALLHMNYFARVPVAKNTYLILRANDAKGHALPIYKCDRKNPPEFKGNFDLVQMQYKFTHNTAKMAENVIRTYASMGARIYGVDYTGTLIIADFIPQQKKVYQMLVDLDVPPVRELISFRAAPPKGKLNSSAKEEKE